MSKTIVVWCMYGGAVVVASAVVAVVVVSVVARSPEGKFIWCV